MEEVFAGEDPAPIWPSARTLTEHAMDGADTL